MITGAGFYAIGSWRDAWKLHGYAKRNVYGKVQEGYFEDAGFQDRPKKVSEIKSFNPMNDVIGRKINFDLYEQKDQQYLV